MRPSRGMGAVAPSKMPKPKRVVRKDNPNEVEMMKSGGSANWIKGAIKKPGSLRKALGAKEGQTIPAGKLAKAAAKPGKIGQRARLAQTLKKLNKG